MAGTFLSLLLDWLRAKTKTNKTKEKSHLGWSLAYHLEDSGKVPWEGSIQRDSLLRAPVGSHEGLPQHLWLGGVFLCLETVLPKLRSPLPGSLRAW